jgi:hypothetical protein
MGRPVSAVQSGTGPLPAPGSAHPPRADPGPDYWTVIVLLASWYTEPLPVFRSTM